MDAGSQRRYGQAVEKGRAELMRRSAEGGDALAKRVKSELNYLLNNYLPRYDARIEQLIDQWRTSGDPSYSPSVRTRLLQARREQSKKSRPI